MIKRVFVDDGWELACAIKEYEDKSLIDVFQEYWKNRCDNTDYLSLPHVLSILMDFAKDNFQSSDWFQFKEYFRFHDIIKGKKDIPLSELINAYLVAIQLMQMCYDEPKRTVKQDTGRKFY